MRAEPAPTRFFLDKLINFSIIYKKIPNERLVYDNLISKQSKTDTTLTTNSKSVVGAINELYAWTKSCVRGVEGMHHYMQKKTLRIAISNTTHSVLMVLWIN